jgi:hypothetical protein
MKQKTLKTNQDTNLRTEEHEKLYHEFGYNLPTEADIKRDMEEDEFNDWEYDYESFEPTFIDTLRHKISNMSKWQLILLFGCVIAADVCLTILAIYLYVCFN